MVSYKAPALAVLLLVFHNTCYGILIWTNTTCQLLDKNYAKMEYCALNLNTTTNQRIFSAYFKLAKPVDNCKIRIVFSGRQKAFPIHFNTTWDACQFMRNTKRFKALKMFYQVISEYSNINHTCPFKDAIIIKNLGPVDVDLNLPMAGGFYDYNTLWIVDDKIRVAIGGIVEFRNTQPTRIPPTYRKGY